MIADRPGSLVLPICLAMTASQTPDQIFAMEVAEDHAEPPHPRAAYRAELGMKDTEPWSIAFWIACITFYTTGAPAA